MAAAPHQSVLLEEAVHALNIRPGAVLIDCTVGAGGHTTRLLEAAGDTGTVVGIDRDQTALRLAESGLGKWLAGGRLKLINAPFSRIAEVVESLGLRGKVDGILADIGVSSMQLDQADRGFSFRHDGPLDMRMDQTGGGRTAADIVNTEPESELIRIFRAFGEEPKARAIAQAIVRRREETMFSRTGDLAEVVKAASKWKDPSRRDPATRVFQALRIAVNNELGELEALLDAGMSLLKPGGRLAVITFHSLEDRLVKHRFLELAGRRGEDLPRGLPTTVARKRWGEIIRPFPTDPSEDEQRLNPRARSAHLRVIEKIADLTP